MARANIKAEVSADTTKFAAGMRRAQTIGRETGKRIAASMKKGGAAMLKMAKRAAVVSASIASIALAAAAFKGVSLAADMEATAVAFKTLTGSAESAEKVISKITELAAATPFEFPELASAGRKLIAFGEGADTVAETLRKIGDVSAGVQAPVEEIAELYGKARVQGRLFGEDINQLTGRGIPIIGQLAKQFNVAEGDVKKLVESGKIGFPQLEKAFGDMTSEGGLFFGMMDAQSKTFNGKMSTLKDSVNGALRAFGEPIMNASKPILDAMILNLGAFTETAAQYGEKTVGWLKTASIWSAHMIDKAVEWGQTLNRWVKIAGALIGSAFSPQFWESVNLSISAAFLEAANVANGAFSGVVAGLRVGFQSALEFLATVMQSFMQPDFWAGLAKTFEWLALSMAQKLSGAIASVLEKIGKIPGMKKLLGSSAENVRGSSDSAGIAADAAKSQADAALNGIGGIIAGAAAKAATNTGLAISNAYAEGLNKFDSKTPRDAAAELMGNVTDEIAEAMKEPAPMKKISAIMKGLLTKVAKVAEVATKDLSIAPLDRTRGPLGGDNVFARDRARLGIASGLTTGGLGERRRVGKSNAEILGYQQKSLQEQGNDILTNIRQDLKQAVAV